MRVLIDTNVILDVLQSREPWHKEGQTIFLAVANHVMTGCITAKQAADIHFFSRKQFVGQENTDEKARKILAGIFSLFEVLDTLAEDSLNAMGITNGDYEDVMMIETAVRSGVDCIITRNTTRFTAGKVPAYTPDEFISRYLP